LFCLHTVVLHALATGVTRFKPGDRVYTLRTRTGAYAELTVAPVRSPRSSDRVPLELLEGRLLAAKLQKKASVLPYASAPPPRRRTAQCASPRRA
jgi:NADPH:quinone reductase-like Zn-dependent oxidoreductase